MADFEDQLSAFVARPEYQPITLKAIAKQLKVDPDDYPELRRAAKALIREGKVELSRNKTLRTPDLKGTVTGSFRRTSKGFGFVRPSQDTGKGRAGDIYIPIDAGLDAATGDEVAVRVVKKAHRPGMNNEGRVVRVLQRASGQFVGTYHERAGSGFVTIDGTTFHDPLFVGDPGAKGARPGDKVTVEIVRYPTPEREGEGVITEILGPRGKPGVDTLTVIRAYNLPDTFDDSVLQEAREVAGRFREDDLDGRLDLRETLTVTIDPATARDFDDAISLSRDDRGYWELGVHIADVSHFVRSGSELDRAARKRGTSVYLPDRVLPMLPEVISNSLASLQQGHVRFAMSALLEFNPEGILTDRRFARSAIRVDQRFTYEKAYEAMTSPGVPIEGIAPEVRALLGRMLELAMLLRGRRMARGALELNMPEVEIELGERGEVVGAHLAKDDESHQVIEEFMLAANEAIASFLTARKVGFLRRTHAEPELSKLRQFAEFARSLGIAIDKPQSRFELQRVLRETADRPERQAVHYGLLRSLKQAIYSPEREGHYALASEDYCHFTSPIRRYPDLQVHRQLVAVLEGKAPRSDEEELAALGEHCTRTERRAEAAERELIKIKLLTHLEGRIGEAFHAVIIGVEDFGLFCMLAELPIEGLIHVTSLADDFYYLEDDTHTLVGRRSGHRYRLGDPLEVRIARVDIDRRQLDLVLASMHVEPPAEDDPELHLPPSVRPARPSSPRPSPSPKRSSPRGKRPTARGGSKSGRRGKKRPG